MLTARRAKQSNKLLFLYLHSSSSSNDFLSNVLCSTEVSAFLNQNFVLYAGSMKNSEAYKVASQLRAQSFPYCALLSIQSEIRAALLWSSNATSLPSMTPEAFIAILFDKLEHFDNQQLERDRVLSEAQQRRLEREIQDQEYQEALRRDQEQQQIEMFRKIEEQRQREELESVRKRAENKAERRRREVEHERNLREQKRQQLTAEPLGTNVVNVSIRLPNGSKTQRKFKDSEPLQKVFDFVDCQEMPSANDEEEDEFGPRQVKQFHLVSNFPRKVHTDRSQTLANLKLGKNIALIVEEIIAYDHEKS